MNTSTSRPGGSASAFSHDGDHGFCSTCGMVWPCSWARRHIQPLVLSIPTSRLPTERS